MRAAFRVSTVRGQAMAKRWPSIVRAGHIRSQNHHSDLENSAACATQALGPRRFGSRAYVASKRPQDSASWEDSAQRVGDFRIDDYVRHRFRAVLCSVVSRPDQHHAAGLGRGRIHQIPAADTRAAVRDLPQQEVGGRAAAAVEPHLGTVPAPQSADNRCA
jgi:hypothetical protein